MTLEQLHILVTVAQSRSFTQAAELLNIQKSDVSRVVTQLETELGAKLLERTTRRLSVTEVGREVVERAVGILGAVEDTLHMVQSTQAEPRGVLRLACGAEFAMLAAGRWVDEYLSLYPAVGVEMEHATSMVDLVHEGFDLAIRVGTLESSRLAARALGQIEYALFACPRYLNDHGCPEDPSQLQQHSLAMFTGGEHRRGWTLSPPDGDKRASVKVDGPARLKVNNSFAVRDALLHGLGIGQLPLLIAADAVTAGKLVPVLPQWHPSPVPVHAVFPSNRYLSPKVRAFIDLAVLRFPADNAQARAVVARAGASAVPEMVDGG